MRRRRLLALLGSGALAGCLGDRSPGSPGGTTASPTGTDRTTTDGTSTGDGTGTTSRSSEGEPLAVRDSWFEGEPCPGFFDDTVCYHSLESGVHETAYVVPEREVLERPSDSTRFTLYNGSDESVGMNPFAWTVTKRLDDGWAYVAPHAVPQPYTKIRPGQRFTWRFGIGDANVEEEAMGSTARIQHLGPGVYAFAHASALVLFEVTGDPLALEPTDVAATKRDGDVLTVTTGRAKETDDPETLVVERTTNPARPATLVTEQVVQSYALRNGLPYLLSEDVTEVRVETSSSTYAQTVLASAYRDPTTDTDAPPQSGRVYVYEGVAFSATEKR
ncbi:hypothetical protein [Halomicrococcus sp. NG-SE-24]|uniref:hypothetical protein n=1 Tax=Halomicrococcus sp. NG-SE-24 TaxID=3436928 RepID=UPI003D95FADC